MVLGGLFKRSGGEFMLKCRWNIAGWSLEPSTARRRGGWGVVIKSRSITIRVSSAGGALWFAASFKT